MTEPDLSEVIAYADAAAAGMPATLGYTPVERPCGHCGQEIPAGRRKFCSDGCNDRAKALRYWHRHHGQGQHLR